MHDDIRREAASRRIVEEAAEWMLAQREGLDERGRADFVAWLRHSPAHVAEYMAIMEWEREMREGASLETLDGPALAAMAAAEPAVVPLHPKLQFDIVTSRNRRATPRSRKRWPWMAGMAAGILMAMAATGAWLNQPSPSGRLYAASSDAPTSFDLPDGSHIQLDKGSRIRVNLTAEARDINVLAGTMLIDVGHDSTAPLRVTTGNTTLRDIGTVFQVRTHDGGSDVTVLSGSVDVLAPRMPLTARLHLADENRDVLAHLHGGQRALLSREGAVATLEASTDLAQDMAWLPGEIEFHDMPVNDVARRFNEYGLSPLVIEDKLLGATRISGRFHGRDPAGFVAYLQTLPGVRVRKEGDGLHITRRDAPDAAVTKISKK